MIPCDGSAVFVGLNQTEWSEGETHSRVPLFDLAAVTANAIC